MRKKFILSFLFILPFIVSAQSSKADLINDLVKIENGKMTLTDYTLLKQGDVSTQIKMYCEAPAAGLISRDYFISLCTVLGYEMINNMKTDPNATTKTLGELIGNPDVEINLFVAKGGIQVEVKGVNGTNRSTITWEELFK